jgi:2'-hydroxyisoflavone reductase
LILGGTGFIGPWQVRYAVARGHQVTVFNRGRRQADLPDGVEHLQGDRNTGDLASLEGRTWDVVIDNPTTLPFWARDAASLLRDQAQHYVFISTISAYRDLALPGLDEGYPLAEYAGADPYAETMQTFAADAEALYGPLKALSEREVERWFPGRTTIVRPGLIVGPGDESDRFTYWPVRIERGGEVIAPARPEVPVQFIDARDLSEWIVRMAEQRAAGVYNATGPASRLSMAEMLYGIRAVTSGSNDVRFVWVPEDFLMEHEVQPWMELTVWFPDHGDTAGAASVSIERALARGLVFRSLAETTSATLGWWHSLPEERRSASRAGLAAEKEARVLEAWRRAQAG